MTLPYDHLPIPSPADLRRAQEPVAQAIASASKRPDEPWAPGKWARRQLAGHVADTESAMLDRVRRVVAHDNPPLAGIDQDAWVAGLPAVAPAVSADLFRACRAALVAIVERLPASALERNGVHSAYGAMCLGDILRHAHGHALHHAAQLESGSPATAALGQRYWIVDAFTKVPFAGNPAAVVPLDRPADVGWMQQVAAEFNLSETVFTWPEEDHWRIRWFTPAAEVALCGHATVAAATVLWDTGLVVGPITFVSASGALPVRREGTQVVLDFPAKRCLPGEIPADLLAALGVAAVAGGKNGMDWLVELADAATVQSVSPDFARLARLPVRGVIVTARSDAGSGWDIVSRFFAPAVGVPEDPVTGSAHCALLPWWVPRLGRTSLICRQISRRGGTVIGTLRGARVDLAGSAVVVAEGRLRSADVG
ncbi:hypothetical protein LBMAG53_26270 [Planctomycetota bacterium]|nr:hypothetical protein LBMAG53_26270 [Planctomycetota bacterium]